MSNLLRITNKIEALGIWDSIPSDSINSVVIEFEFAEDWKNLLCVAQFTQGEKTYNVVIENNRCVLPTELKVGNVMLSVFGTKTDGTPFRETSIPFCFEIYDAGFSSTAETPIPPTPDLYEQLIDKFANSNGVAALNGKTGNVDIVADEGISVDDTETGKIKIKNTAKVTVDTEMSETSENPVQNKVIVETLLDLYDSLSNLNSSLFDLQKYVDDVASDISDEVAKKLDTIYGGTVRGTVRFISDVIVQNAPTSSKSAVNKEYADKLKTVIDPEISDTSENPVQNKVVKGYIDDKTKQGHLIYQTTLTEDVHQISISKDSNGQEFLLNNIAVIVCIPASPTLNSFSYLSLKINDFLPYNNQTVITKGEEGKKHVVIFRCDRDNGLWSRMVGTSLNQIYTDFYMPSLKSVEYWDYYVNKFEPATAITLAPTGGADRIIPKGTKIEVYGR